MRRSPGPLGRVLGVLAVSVALLAPSSVATAAPRSEDAGSDAGRATVHRVRMVDRDRNVFRPRRIRIARRDVVRWTNRGNLAHTATGSSWNSGTLSPGETFRRRFRRSGRFPYQCLIHPEMTGVVIVR